VIAAACGVFVTTAVSGCGRQTEGTAAGPPPLSAAEQAKAAEQVRQAEISARTAQINRSGLPPDQKQRLLEQVRATAGNKQAQ